MLLTRSLKSLKNTHEPNKKATATSLGCQMLLHPPRKTTTSRKISEGVAVCRISEVKVLGKRGYHASCLGFPWLCAGNAPTITQIFGSGVQWRDIPYHNHYFRFQDIGPYFMWAPVISSRKPDFRRQQEKAPGSVPYSQSSGHRRPGPAKQLPWTMLSPKCHSLALTCVYIYIYIYIIYIYIHT